MPRHTPLASTLLALALLLATPFTVPRTAQAAQGRGRMQHDDAHDADMALFHALIDDRASIRRTVTRLPDGVDTLTESDDPAVAARIRAHVASMAARVERARPIHQRDPLFRAIFEHASAITVRHEPTSRGVRVIETSTDPYVARLVQAHAEVVSGFIANGRSEMMRNHEVPPR